MKITPFESGCYYHLYNRGNNKEHIFFEDENYSFFLNLMIKYILPVSEVYSYCLLPNHYHILIKIKEVNNLPENYTNGKAKLSQPFSNFLNAYTKSINKKYGREGSLFQKNLKKIKITNEKYLQNLILYINTNPSHHEIENYKTYKHSSYKTLISNQKTNIYRKDVIELFDNLNNLKYRLENKKMNLEIIQNLTFDD